MSRSRVVLDTNIIISAHKTKGVSFKIFERFKQGHFDLFLNAHLFSEYDNKLNELFRNGTISNADDISKNLNESRKRGIFVPIPVGIQFPTNDPDDRSLFEIAAVTLIDYIVTTDKRDVLKYKDDRILNGAKIINPEDFIKVLKSENKKLHV